MTNKNEKVIIWNSKENIFKLINDFKNTINEIFIKNSSVTVRPKYTYFAIKTIKYLTKKQIVQCLVTFYRKTKKEQNNKYRFMNIFSKYACKEYEKY